MLIRNGAKGGRRWFPGSGLGGSANGACHPLGDGGRTEALFTFTRRRAHAVRFAGSIGGLRMATARKLGPDLKVKPYEAPTGGWGSVRSLARSLSRDHVPFTGPLVLLKQNKPDGYMCVSCAWAKPADPRVFEFCENGAKATTWEITHKRVTPDFFAKHTIPDLEKWDDHQLEAAGRLTHPMRWDPKTDKYVPIEWAK